MNITGYKKHLKEMKSLLKLEKAKKESLIRNRKINSLEHHIPQCHAKIKQLQEKRLKKIGESPRKKLKGRNPKGRRRLNSKKSRNRAK